MESVTVWVASVAAVLSIIVTLAVALGWRASTRRTAAQIAELREALAVVTSAPTQVAPHDPVVAEFLITDIGTEAPEIPDEVSSRLVLSATVGEPLVRLAAFAYGVRKALTPENRNRIRFEMRREIRRARKARRAAGRAAAAEARAQAVRS
ncbi:MAG: hypothetical protein ACTHJM_11235 [Marmoricola sp.]